MSSHTELATSLERTLCRALVEAITESLIIVDCHGIIRTINPAAERLFGYGRLEVIGQSVTLLIPAWQLRQAQRGAETSEARISGSRIDVQGLRKDGTSFPMHLSLSELHGAPEQIFLGVAHELSDQRSVEKQPGPSADIFEHAIEAMMITDCNGTIEAVNPAFTELTGYTRDDVLGHDNSEFLKSGWHDALYYTTIWQSIHNDGAWRGEIWNRRKDGRFRRLWLSISALKNSRNESTSFLAIYSDISSLKHNEQRFEYLAHHDPLTGLANRLLLSAHLDHAIRRHPRRGGLLALLFLDLDGFKQINDTWGHDTGDLLLVEVAKRVTDVVRHEDTVARFGGDEFTILLEQLAAPTDAESVARKVLTTLSCPFRVDGHELSVSASIGISLFPTNGKNLEELLRAADRAMYCAKGHSGIRRSSFAFASDSGTYEWPQGSWTRGKPHQLARSANIGTQELEVVPSATKNPSDEIGEKTVKDHKRTLALVDELLMPSTTRSVSELTELLRELYQLLTIHFAEEEGRGGFFDVVSASSDEYQDEILALMDQHFKALSDLAGLLKLAQTLPVDMEANEGPIRLFLGAAQLAQTIKNHEQTENKLVANMGYSH